MKAVLVIEEMPKCCFACPLSVDRWCYGTNDCGISESWEERPKWCPLKKLPEQIKGKYTLTGIETIDRGYVNGWNDCLEELEK